MHTSFVLVNVILLYLSSPQRIVSDVMFPQLLQESSNPTPAEADSQAEPWRAAIDDAFKSYVKDHYPHGVSTVSSVLSVVQQ